MDALALLVRLVELSPSQTHEIVDDADAGLQQLRRRMASLLDLLRAQDIMSRRHAVSFDPWPILDRLFVSLAPLAAHQKVELRAVTSKRAVVGDPLAFEVILRNLIINAICFAPGGRVLVGCRRRRGDLLFQVVDNGSGFPEEHAEELFEPLTKVENGGDQRVEGLGLGLSLVRRLAVHQGLSLEVRSRSGAGSSFLVRFPLADPEASRG